MNTSTLIPNRLFLPLREKECVYGSMGSFYLKLELFAYEYYQPLFGSEPDEVPVQRLRMSSECSTLFAIYDEVHNQ